VNAVLLAPAALAALAALALPLLIHLARKQQLKTLDFAALRWLRANPRPQKRLHLEDWPLLLTRLVLLALIALWLAKPAMYGMDEKTPYVAMMPGVSAPTLAAQNLPKQARLHWLSLDFPALPAAAPTTPQPTASLLRQLDAELPADVPMIVITTAQFDGADAQALQLSRKIDWRITTNRPPQTQPAQGLPKLYVWADTSQSNAASYFEAAAFAWMGNNTHYLVQTNFNPPSTTADTVVWLNSRPLPQPILQWVRAGGTALTANTTPLSKSLQLSPHWQDENGQTLVEGAALGQGQLLRFTRAVNTTAIPLLMDVRFPEQLRTMLQPNAQQATRADARAYRPNTGARRAPQPPLPLGTWLGVLVALVFLFERGLSLRNRQGAAA
jgi:hypothetical protein